MTEAQLRAFLPTLPDPAVWTRALNAACDRFEISSPARLAAFLAQTAHESNGFTRLDENLNYSAERILAVWPKRFPPSEDDERRACARNPERLANVVYARRMGNGDKASGDGWRFHGRGIIQITGRGNYRACGLGLGLDLEATPERVLDREIAALSAAWFWETRGCNELADDTSEDDDDEDFERITVIINGGRSGLADRRAYWARAQQALA